MTERRNPYTPPQAAIDNGVTVSAKKPPMLRYVIGILLLILLEIGIVYSLYVGRYSILSFQLYGIVWLLNQLLSFGLFLAATILLLRKSSAFFAFFLMGLISQYVLGNLRLLIFFGVKHIMFYGAPIATLLGGASTLLLFISLYWVLKRRICDNVATQA